MKIHVEVYIASRILEQNQGSFTPQDLINFIHKEFKDDRPGVNTHVSSVCIANAPLNHPIGYNYLWRIKPGLLRTFVFGQDTPGTQRLNYECRPKKEDIPEKYLSYLR